jgi:hypothetical protein
MSNERPNEFLPWRVTLTKIDALPGHGLDDKEQSWERLAGRLRKQPRRRGIVWWMAGVAAACLVVIFLLPGTIFQARPVVHNHEAVQPPAQPQPGTRAPSRPQPNPVAGSAALPAHAEFGANSNYGDFAAVRHRVENHISAVLQTAAPDIAVTDAPPVALTVAPPAVAPLTVAPPTVAVPNSPNTPSDLAAAAPGRRQLRIAYLNELGKDPGPSEEPSFRKPAFLRLGNAGDWAIIDNAASILKIDIFPLNH